MKILSFDSSSPHLSLCYQEPEKICIEYDFHEPYQHNKLLVKGIADIMAAAAENLGNLDFLVCGIGPGSFMGIRIALSVAKAFMAAHTIPVIGVSALEAICLLQRGLRVALQYNGTRKCYFCAYRNGKCLLPLQGASRDDFKGIIQEKRRPGELLILSAENNAEDTDGLEDLFPAPFVFLKQRNLARAMIPLAMKKYHKKDFLTENAIPLYLDRPHINKQGIYRRPSFSQKT